MAKKNESTEPVVLSSRDRLKNAKIVHTSVLQVKKTESTSQPDLRSPDEKNKEWHRPPEDLREEKKSQVEEIGVDAEKKE